MTKAGALTEAVEKAISEGYFMNGLHQNEDGSWRAHLRRPSPRGTFFNFGDGVTAAEAVGACLAKSMIELGEITLPSPPRNHIKNKTVELDSVLRELGL